MTFQLKLSHKQVLLAGFLLVVGTLVSSGHASAASVSGTGYFNGGTHYADPWNYNSDVISSRTAPTGTPYAIPATVYDGVNEKADFLNWLASKRAPLNTCPTTHNQWGAAFIINSLLGQPAGSRQECVTSAMWSDLTDRINSTDISIGMQNMDPNSISQNTSFYDPTAPLDFFYAPWPAGPRDILVFRRLSTNTVVSYLEIPCGNPIGNLSLPRARHPSVTITPNCAAQNVAITADDADYSTAGISVTVYFGGPPSAWTTVGTKSVNPGGTMTVDTPPLTAAQLRAWRNGGANFYALAKGVSSGGVQDGINTTTAVVNSAACNDGFCNGNTFPSSMSVGVPVSFTVGFRLSFPYGAPYTVSNPAIRVVLRDPVGNIVTTVPASGGANVSYPTTAGNSTFTSTALSFTPSMAGRYTMNQSLVGTGTATQVSVNCAPDTADSSLRPFFVVNGGDVMAGSGVGNGSCASLTAGVKGWNKNTAAGTYFGAGSEVGTFATGTLNNYVTGMGLTGGATAQAGLGLSFANSGGATTANPNYGGSFGANSLPCTPDYYGNATGSNAFPGIALASGDYSLTTATLNLAGGVLPAGRTVNLYVSGNVLITGDITYAPYSLGNVPRFNLYVSGNIYIAPGVHELHGVYVAQLTSSGAGGELVTCASNTTNVAETYAACNSKLLIVGSVTAEKQIRMTRTYGGVDAAPGVPAEPGETFQYSPELWMVSPPTKATRIQSYTNLAPVL